MDCYRVFPAKFLSDPAIRRLSLIERAALRELMDVMWQTRDRCRIPDDAGRIARLLGMDVGEWESVREALLDDFAPALVCEDGHLESGYLREELEAAGGVAPKPAQATKPKRPLPKDVKTYNLPESDRSLGPYDGFFPTSSFNRRGEVVAIPDEWLVMFRDAYPGIDVDEELRRAYTWCVSNDTKRKTARGIKKFLQSWMERSQNRSRSGPPRRQPPQQVAPAPHAAAPQRRRTMADEIRDSLGDRLAGAKNFQSGGLNGTH